MRRQQSVTRQELPSGTLVARVLNVMRRASAMLVVVLAAAACGESDGAAEEATTSGHEASCPDCSDTSEGPETSDVLSSTDARSGEGATSRSPGSATPVDTSGSRGSASTSGTPSPSSDDPAEATSTDDGLPRFGDPREMGRLPEGVVEASGLVQSAWDDDRLWVHNDSSYAPELFAIRQDGTLLSTITLPVPNRDWEDIARGPCHAGDTQRACLYVGEIGDNAERYDRIAIHRVREPETLSETMALEREEVETMYLVYPDRPQDAEALVVDDDLRIWILSKRPPGVTRLYTTEFRVSEPIPADDSAQGSEPANEAGSSDEPEEFELTFVREFDLSEIRGRAGSDYVTAADWDPERRLFLLRQYFSLWMFHVPSGDLHDLFDASAISVPNALERQGEAVAWLRSGGYMHVSEGARARLWRIDPEP